MPHADIAVICAASISFDWETKEEVTMDTPYGPTSDFITVGKVCGKDVAFMPRHGFKHTFPPHRIPFKANMWAFKQLGVSRIIALNTVGSLQPDIHPGEFVICDQFVDRPSGRDDTFFNGPQVAHISAAYPFCPEMRELAIKLGKAEGIKLHDKGACVVIQGPRFSTCAESEWFTKMGWAVVNMTLYPECVLAKEQEMCYMTIALVTDYDSGLVADGKVEPVTNDEVVRVMASNVKVSQTLIMDMIKNMPAKASCNCANSLDGALIN